MLVPSNRLWDIGSFLVEFTSGPVVFFHIEVMVFTTDLATFTASQNTEIDPWETEEVKIFHCHSSPAGENFQAIGKEGGTQVESWTLLEFIQWSWEPVGAKAASIHS